MLVRVYRDKNSNQYIVTINDSETHVCRALWLDHEPILPSDEEDDFNYIYVEARLLKIIGETCVINTLMLEIVDEEED